MAIQVLQLGLSGSEQTLPTESRINEEGVPELLKITENAVDGTIHTDFVTFKESWTITWETISKTNYDTIKAILDLQISTPSFLSFKYTDSGGTFTTVEVEATIVNRGALVQVGDYYYQGFSIFLQQVS